VRQRFALRTQFFDTDFTDCTGFKAEAFMVGHVCAWLFLTASVRGVRQASTDAVDWLVWIANT
jgi:hypothetical protein